jgi:YVTN family beta-propeller protein
MSFRRVGWLAATALATLLWISCGQVYRPVVIPVATDPPNPSGFHQVFGINNNVAFNAGTALQIDVAGDSDIGAAAMGVNPTHAAILPNDSRVFVAAAGSMFAGDSDVVTAFTPAVDSSIAVGLGIPTVFSLPNVVGSPSAGIAAISESGSTVTVTLSAALTNAVVGATISIASVPVTGYNGTFAITSVSGATLQYQDPTAGLAASSGGNATIFISCSYLPDFLTTAQATAVYLANYGVESDPNCNLASTDSVASLNPGQTTITNIAYLPAGSHPVGLIETSDALNLYVLNEGNNTVTDLSPTDLSTLATIAIGPTPVWVVARVDNERVYVVTQGDGNLSTIDTSSNTVISIQPVGGPGANYVLYDSVLNRLYVVNPAASTVFVFSTTGGTNDTPSLIATIAMTGGATSPCPNGCTPVSVAALPDGSRFYVASYQTESSCTDPVIGTGSACIIPMLSVFDASSFTLKPVTGSMLPTSLSLLAPPQFAIGQFGVAPDSSCAPAATYAPGTTRFRMYTTPSTDASHVYVSMCDAASIADIAANTTNLATGGTNTPDILVTNITPPFSAAAPGVNNEPPPQNPIFLLAGQ